MSLVKKVLVACATIGLLVISGIALAAPKAAAPSGTLTMESAASRAGATEPARGDSVSLGATYAGLRKQDTVRVQLLCMQDIGVVYGDAITLSGTPQNVTFTLGENSTTATSVWTGGSSQCEGDLFYIANAGGGTVHYLDSITFSATG